MQWGAGEAGCWEGLTCDEILTARRGDNTKHMQVRVQLWGTVNMSMRRSSTAPWGGLLATLLEITVDSSFC